MRRSNANQKRADLGWALTVPTRNIFGACCARAASGHIAAARATTLMKSRRRIAFPKAKDRVNVGSRYRRSKHEIATGGIGPLIGLRSSNPDPRMSPEGQNAKYSSRVEIFRFA